MAEFFNSVVGFFENILGFFQNMFETIISFFAIKDLLISPINNLLVAGTFFPVFLAPFLILSFAVLVIKLLLDLL